MRKVSPVEVTAAHLERIEALEPILNSFIAGGSSGGSGSAAAAGEYTLTMASDAGGFLRIPSALCGVVDLKPTCGRLSLCGVSSAPSGFCPL